MKLRTRLVIVGGAVIGVGAAAGAAYAYFSAGGSGTGSATVGTGVNVELELASELPALVPGTPVPVAIKVTNPAGAPTQALSSVTLSVTGVTQVDPNAAGPKCTVADFAATSPTIATPQKLAAGASVTVTGSLELKNLDADQDNCRGATVALAFDAA